MLIGADSSDPPSECGTLFGISHQLRVIRSGQIPRQAGGRATIEGNCLSALSLKNPRASSSGAPHFLSLRRQVIFALGLPKRPCAERVRSKNLRPSRENKSGR